jgi:hypothetical protein
MPPFSFTFSLKLKETKVHRLAIAPETLTDLQAFAFAKYYLTAGFA